MKNKLLIVESPSKTKKIAHYLGEGWQVEASFGHIRDLPVHEIGVSAPDYAPVYEVGERSQKQVAKLKALAKEASEIWLATDPDREGEAIAWHLYELLGRGKTVKRVTFNEITESAVKKAIANPRDIDMNLVMAQQGRRVLDRLYGYKISPMLSSKLCEKGVSAGRVQSVALKLIVEREQEIQRFVATKHFGVSCQFETDHITWQAKWKKDDFITEDNPYITDRSEAQKVVDAADLGLIVTDYQEQEKKRKPQAPLITSTLQQAAANKLKMSVGDTMKAAQTLFEAGLITYMRTDNPNLSDEAIASLHDFLASVGQSTHIAPKPNKWKAKDDAQEAHEAIRPTDFAVKDAPISDEHAKQLYALIRRVAIASQMADAVYKVRTATLQTTQAVNLENVPNPQTAPAIFSASGSECLYKGWQIMAADDYTDEDGDETSSLLPQLQEQQQYKPEAVNLSDLETRSPRRYSETSLVKALEKHGIGRPATYANIIETQLKREYAVLEKRLFKPTELGKAVESALDGRFAIMDTAYTADMESQLDAVAQGCATYRDIVGHYDNALDNELADFTQATIKPYGNVQTYPCPECKEGHLRKLKGKSGVFWGCSNYKSGCKCTRPDANGKPGEQQTKQSINTDHPCPECGKGYLQRYPSKKKKNTFWWGCSEYKNGCTYTTIDNVGKPK